MRAIILAAGIASRLQPITYKKPKTLVHVNSKPIISYVLDALSENGVHDIVLCIGYRGDQIIKYVTSHYPQLHFTFITNSDYESTNNMFTLYLAKAYLSEDCLIMNADVVFDKSVIQGLTKTQSTSVAIDPQVYYEESMKVTVNHGRITSISKTIPQNKAFGCSIDVYRVNQADTKLLVAQMKSIIEVQSDRNQWTEVMLNQLFMSHQLQAKPHDIQNARWFEIDNFDDLAQAEILFNSYLPKLNKQKAFFLDKDGTITKDSQITPAANAFLKHLQHTSRHFYILTNNSSKTPLEHQQSLALLGLKLKSPQILTSLDATVTWLKTNGFHRLYWLANSSVSRYLRQLGFTKSSTNPQAVLLTWDTEVTYAKLIKFCHILRSKLPYYATHPDLLCPTSTGPIPDIGCLINLIESVTGILPDKIFGKPHVSMLQTTLDRLSVSPKKSVIIGDRLYTDIQLAKDIGALSILVLSGETTRADYEFSPQKADIVVPDVSYLIPHIS